MELKKLHDPKSGQMRIAGFMSGSGSNICKIMDLERSLEKTYGESPFKVVVLFTENPESRARDISLEYKIPCVTRDMAEFYSLRGKPRKDLEVRAEFDAETVKALLPFDATVAAYAGYMSIATRPLIDAFLGVNVHPADLSVMVEGRRKYTGAHAVRDAILAGDRYIHATTHLLEERVDYGRILMMSQPVEVIRPAGLDKTDKAAVNRVADANQERLKKEGDWLLFPLTMLYMAKGRFSQDGAGELYFDDLPIPQGLRFCKDK